MSASAACSLYEIQDNLLACLDTIEGLPDEAQDLRAELEEQIAGLIAAELTKVDGVSRMMAHFESQADLATLEVKRLQTRKKFFERASGRLELCVRLAMEVSGRTKLEGETSSLRLQKSPASVFISNFGVVPPEYVVTEIVKSIDKVAVKKAIQSGTAVSGAELVFGTHLVRG